MKKMLAFIALVGALVYSYAAPGEGIMYYEELDNCNYLCEEGGMTIQRINCRSEEWSGCWRSLCPNISNVCF